MDKYTDQPTVDYYVTWFNTTVTVKEGILLIFPNSLNIIALDKR